MDSCFRKVPLTIIHRTCESVFIRAPFTTVANAGLSSREGSELRVAQDEARALFFSTQARPVLAKSATVYRGVPSWKLFRVLFWAC